jgi:tripartite-type tricarboxylate transporter receptor subunit TctC
MPISLNLFVETMVKPKLLFLWPLLCALGLLPSTQALAYPIKPIKLVVPFPAGGSTDMVARLLAERMSPLLGQAMVVENRGGGGGVMGADAVAKASPDGHTLLMATVSTHGASPAIHKKIPYDPIKDFQPITNVMAVPSVLMVHPKLPAKDLKAFISLAKSAPGQYSYGSPGAGSVGHANVEKFTQLAGIRLLHVPYKGAGPAMNDALAGQVDVLTDNLPSALTHIQAGRLRALAVLSPQRSPLLPHVPTYLEAGFKDMSEGGWFGLMAPAGTPAVVVKKLKDAAHKAMKDPSFKQRTDALGGLSMANTPEEFAVQVKAALTRYQAIAQAAQIQPE